MIHAPECRYRKAVLSTVGIECQHGYDVCPECDPCHCAGQETPKAVKRAGQEPVKPVHKGVY